MSFLSGINNLQRISPADIQGMDLQTAMLAVNSSSIGNHQNSLKTQVADVQERNIKMSETNELMSAARTLMSKFDTEATSSTALPTGDEFTAFKNTAGALGFSLKDIQNKAELGTAIENFKTQVDSLGNTQQIAMLHMQSASNKHNEAVTAQTNLLKSMHDLNSAIIGNMR